MFSKNRQGGELAEAELTGHKRRVVELVGRRIARGRGAFDHFATTMMKFGWKNTGLDKGIKDHGRYLVRTAGLKSELEWKDQFIILLVR